MHNLLFKMTEPGFKDLKKGKNYILTFSSDSSKAAQVYVIKSKSNEVYIYTFSSEKDIYIERCPSYDYELNRRAEKYS